MSGKVQAERETENWIGLIKSRIYGTEKIICGGREEEEEAGTVKHSVWRGTFIGQGVGTHCPGKRRQCYKEKHGCENGNLSELTLRGDQHWHKLKIEWSQTLGQPWAGPCLFVLRLE